MDDYCMTREQAEEEMQQFQKIFSVVRIIGLEQLQLLAEGKAKELDVSPCRCYDFWKRGEACGNCVSLRAFQEKAQCSKLEFLDSEIYQVTARYVVIDGEPCVMELIKRMDKDVLCDAHDREQLLDKLSSYKEKLYLDALTGAYNRRYYEDEVKHRTDPTGIAMIDLDDFKLYNDTYGHNTGDIALVTVATEIRKCIRKTDMLIRYGGDEFLLVLPGINEENFTRRLQQIHNKVHKADVPGYTRLQLSVSIGGVLSAGSTVEAAVTRADKLMYQAKNQKNMVVTESSGIGKDGKAYPLKDRERIKQQVLIVDDSELNREILATMLEEDFYILEATNGEEALLVLQQNPGIALVLLDIVMPVKDGFEVLTHMAQTHMIEDIPVIMISSEDSEENIRRAYELGVSDYISRPFDSKVVFQRVLNTIKLYAKQRRLISLVTDQIYEKEKNSRLMVGILSQIVEFRNGESGLHVRHINVLTEMLLARLVQKTGKYHLSWSEQYLIALASALHDIGKIGIDEKILNKPGKLTAEEFEIMKSHTLIGASMLESLDAYQDEVLVRIAIQICRWHHERYDGSGYPDGLKGDEIPISAQVVSIADVYDALVSERVYKKAFSHEKAIEMILSGECGVFNPLLLECLLEIQDKIKEVVTVNERTWKERIETETRDHAKQVTGAVNLPGGAEVLNEVFGQTLQTGLYFNRLQEEKR